MDRGDWPSIRPTVISSTHPIARRRDPLRRRPACGLVDNVRALPTTPQARQPQQKRSIHMVLNAVTFSLLSTEAAERSGRDKPAESSTGSAIGGEAKRFISDMQPG
jgi:hypothetical protein